MIHFPLPDGRLLLVIEPGNIKRLKEGRGLKVGDHLVCFTPDMQKFVEHLGVNINVNDVQPGSQADIAIEITAEALTSALQACQDLPEVDR